jgi:hypothetical protein
MKKTVAFVCLLFIFAGCSTEIDHEYVRARTWIHEDGFMLDSVPGFEFISGKYTLVGDTIFSGGQPRAVVTALHKTDNLLKIKSIPGGEAGKYLDQVEYTR